MSEFFLFIILSIILLCLFVVLTERKLLAHAQRRFGPSIAGRNGWMQIILDLLKLLVKDFFILPKSNSFMLPILITSLYAIQLLFIQNFIFSPSNILFDQIDGIIFYHLILVMLSNILLLIIGFVSQSKYSIIAVVRGVVHVVSMDVYITITAILIIFSSQSGNFHDFMLVQINYPFLILFLPLSFAFLIIMLVESKRAPFDHIETEAEVVAGYATEHSSIFLLIFYLIEYMHLIVSANHFTIFFLGGWSLYSFKNFIFPIFLNYYEVSYWFSIF